MAAQEYLNFVADTASKISAFKPLQAFLQCGSITYDDLGKPRGVTKITHIAFSAQGLPSKPTDIVEKDLEDSLAAEGHSKLYIVENISPSATALLGGTWKVDPQFFLDYLDHAPWWRINDVEPNLPALPSIKKTVSNHIALDFLASREFHPADEAKVSTKLPDRIEAVELASGSKKVGGGFNPIPRDGKEFHAVGLFRRSIAVWFGPEFSSHGWRQCIILVDPPFKASHEFGPRRSSKYRSFTARPMMPSVQDRDIDDRRSYRTALVHCLKHNRVLDRLGIPFPLLLLRDMYRIMASEWIAVHAYIERDLNKIEWCLENTKHAQLDMLESFMAQLFILRRRVKRYGLLLDEQLLVILTHHPIAWAKRTTDTADLDQPSVAEIQQLLSTDFSYVQRLFQTNDTRIDQIFGILMPLISIRDGKASITQNRSLGFLTALATIILPFNAVAAIMAIPGSYGPGGGYFWVFWTASILSCVVVLISFTAYRKLV